MNEHRDDRLRLEHERRVERELRRKRLEALDVDETQFGLRELVDEVMSEGGERGRG